jgi:hypothetical protein
MVTNEKSDDAGILWRLILAVIGLLIALAGWSLIMTAILMKTRLWREDAVSELYGELRPLMFDRLPDARQRERGRGHRPGGLPALPP